MFWYSVYFSVSSARCPWRCSRSDTGNSEIVANWVVRSDEVTVDETTEEVSANEALEEDDADADVLSAGSDADAVHGDCKAVAPSNAGIGGSGSSDCCSGGGGGGGAGARAPPGGCLAPVAPSSALGSSSTRLRSRCSPSDLGNSVVRLDEVTVDGTTNVEDEEVAEEETVVAHEVAAEEVLANEALM